VGATSSIADGDEFGGSSISFPEGVGIVDSTGEEEGGDGTVEDGEVDVDPLGEEEGDGGEDVEFGTSAEEEAVVGVGGGGGRW